MGEPTDPVYARSVDTVDVVPRKEFLRQFGKDYRAGQHVTMLGPTQRGKTTLCLQLLKHVIKPELQCVILAGKPPGRDGTMGKAPEYLNLTTVEEWPPTTYEKLITRVQKKNGYLLRPHQTLKDLAKDNANLATQYQRAMLDCYAAPPDKPVIIVIDEAHHVQNDLKLKDEYEAPLMRGAPVDAEWSLIQRGRYMSYLAYDAPEHLFIFYDPDTSNVKRYSEIGGIDPRRVQFLVENLRTHEIKTGQTISEALYIRRAGPRLSIVDFK
jgi:hypothetical protein